MFDIINLTTTPTNASCSPYFHTCRNEVSKKACLATVTMGSGSIVHVSCLQNSSLVSSSSMCHDPLNFCLRQHSFPSMTCWIRMFQKCKLLTSPSGSVGLFLWVLTAPDFKSFIWQLVWGQEVVIMKQVN